MLVIPSEVRDLLFGCRDERETEMTNLFIAYAVVWVIVLGYVVSIASRQNTLRREIAMLKSLLEQKTAEQKTVNR